MSRTGLRRARLRRREPGHRRSLPDGAEADAEALLRSGADQHAARFLDAAVRELSEHLAGLDPAPEVVHLTHDTTDVVVHLAGRSHDPPDGWEAVDTHVWRRERPESIDALITAAGGPSRLPALVTLGETSDGRIALLNLAHTHRLDLRGDQVAIERLLTTWALELATTQRADALDVITLGVKDLPTGLERLERLDSAEHLRDILSRCGPKTDTAVPSTVILAARLSDDLDELVHTLCGAGSSIVAVIGGDLAGGEVTLEVDPTGHARLDPIGVVVESLCIGDDVLPMTARLFEQVLHDPDQLVSLPPDPSQTEALQHTPVLAGVDEAELPVAMAPEPPMEVRVLGPVEVIGAVHPFRTTKTVELVVYLALRRGGADTDTLLEALWPGQEPRPARVYTEASRAWKSLGAAPDGSPHLPDAELGRYRLESSVGLDYERFAEAVAAAGQDPDRAAGHLRCALELVRGVPLSATAMEYAWATHEGYRLAQEVVDAAHQLAELSFEAEQWDDCTWAAERGLLADPLAEMLVRDLMQAAAATGNTARVYALMTQLRQQIAEDGDANQADDWLHPDTVTLFQSLTSATVGRHHRRAR